MKAAFKTQLKNQQVLLGSVITLPCTTTTEIISKVGFDWLWLDMEHAPLTLEKIQEMMQAVGDRCACLVRSPWNDSVSIKRILDTGCEGIIIPQIKTPREARQAVVACKYPPSGIRSAGIGRAQNYGMNLEEYLCKANDDLTIVLQIEHIEAVNNIEAIVDVPGFDAILVGPFDLSASMGSIGQIDSPEVQKAVDSVKEACLKKGIPVGIFASSSQGALSAMKNGFTLIGVGIDSMYLWKSALQTINEIKSSAL